MSFLSFLPSLSFLSVQKDTVVYQPFLLGPKDPKGHYKSRYRYTQQVLWDH